jgi:hypothetical protein
LEICSSTRKDLGGGGGGKDVESLELAAQKSDFARAQAAATTIFESKNYFSRFSIICFVLRKI